MKNKIISLKGLDISTSTKYWSRSTS